MIYLIKYHRRRSKAEIQEFADDRLDDAQAARQKAEIAALHAAEKPEIVILEAKTFDDLRKNYARYFGETAVRESIDELTSYPVPRTD